MVKQVAQHFLLSAQARTLSLARVLRLSESKARDTFRKIRWQENDGEPVCPRCACLAIYTYKARKIFKCKACEKQFSLTTDTIFASRKLSYRDILAAIAIFVNGAKGVSALQLSRDLDVQYKTAFVLAHKLREAMGKGLPRKVSGHVEIDGAYFGGYVKPRNRKANRVDRRLVKFRTGKRRVVVVMRERNGRSLPFVFKAEGHSLPTIRTRVTNNATIYADEASAWDALHARFDTKRINHSIAYAVNGVSTNQAESFFARLRRIEANHHRISGKYLSAYANEAAWREDFRRESNGDQFLFVAAASAKHPVSRKWSGYWQRAAAH